MENERWSFENIENIERALTKMNENGSGDKLLKDRLFEIGR